MSMCSLRWHFTNKSVTGAPCSKLSKSYSLSHSWTIWWRVRWLNQCRLEVAAELQQRRRRTDMELGHWVIFHVRVIILTQCETRVFAVFEKKCPKCKTYIWNGEMTKVTVRCLLLDWNPWMSVHAMNFYFYLWLLKILWWPENTSHKSTFGVH